MTTHILAFQRPVFGRRGLVASAGALVVAGTLFLGFQGAPDESAFAANRDVEMHMARLPVQDLKELTAASDAVVVGRVVATGATHFILPSGQAPHPFQPQALPKDMPKDKLANTTTTRELGRSNTNIITPPPGMPATDFTVEVTQALRGGLQAGSKVTVTQPGGVVEIPLGAGAPVLKRTMLAEHDPLMVEGQEQVLFLHKVGADYVVAGGPDGRFKLDAKKTLQPIDSGSPVGNQQKGQTVTELRDKLNALRLGGAAN